MKASPVDTFCRAVVMGALLCSAGWAMVQYTTFPQQALQKIIVWSKRASEQIQQKPGPGAPQIGSNNTVQPKIPLGVRPLMTGSPPQPVPLAATPAFSEQQATHLEPSGPFIQSRQTLNSCAAIEQRLRQLGAVYSLLEMWHHENSLYRYHCRIAMAGNPRITRSFEANGNSPETAMEQVLQKVESFRIQDSGPVSR